MSSALLAGPAGTRACPTHTARDLQCGSAHRRCGAAVLFEYAHERDHDRRDRDTQIIGFTAEPLRFGGRERDPDVDRVPAPGCHVWSISARDGDIYKNCL